MMSPAVPTCRTRCRCPVRQRASKTTSWMQRTGHRCTAATMVMFAPPQALDDRLSMASWWRRHAAVRAPRRFRNEDEGARAIIPVCLPALLHRGTGFRTTALQDRKENRCRPTGNGGFVSASRNNSLAFQRRPCRTKANGKTCVERL